MKRTFQPSNLKRKRRHGFRTRMATKAGRRIIKARRAKGRARLSAWVVSGRSNHRQSKLRNDTDFRCVFDTAARSSDALFTVLARSNGHDYPRLGLAIGRKRIRRAVDRNKIKRLIRESFRQHRVQLRGLDVVVMARCNGQAENTRIFCSLDKHWKQLGHYRDSGKVPAVSARHE